MATLKSTQVGPPGGWRYVQPETAARFSADDYEELCRQVTEHREYKEIPTETVGLDIQRQICASAGLDYCRPEEGEDYRPIKDLSARLTTSMALAFSRALAAFVFAGAKFVEKPEAQRRADVCRGCPFNKPATLCSCSEAYKMIDKLIPSDRKVAGVSVCMACGCSLQAKVNLPLSVIAQSLPKDLVLPDWCWQKEAQSLAE